MHFLLGLLREGRSQAALVLRKRGVDYEKVLQKAKERSEELAAEGSLLNLYATDLTKMAKEGKIGPIIGQDREVGRVIEILMKKMAIVEGLAQRIFEGKVLEQLKNFRILMLDLGRMLAGTKYRGEFEERLKSFLDQLMKQKENTALFTDGIHITNLMIAGEVKEGQTVRVDYRDGEMKPEVAKELVKKQ